MRFERGYSFILVSSDVVAPWNRTTPHQLHETTHGSFDKNVHDEAQSNWDDQISPEDDQLYGKKTRIRKRILENQQSMEQRINRTIDRLIGQSINQSTATWKCDDGISMKKFVPYSSGWNGPLPHDSSNTRRWRSGQWDKRCKKWHWAVATSSSPTHDPPPWPLP